MLSVGGGALCETVIEKLGSEAVTAPSVAMISTSAYVPTSEVVGVPTSCPVVALKIAQAGLFWMLNTTVPLLLTTLGWNEYGSSA